MTDERPDPPTHSRRLMRGAIKATIATSLPTNDGWPYASLVTVAHDQNLSPILLLSTLSDHTRALQADPRLSLLYEDTAGFANPQQGPRVTVLAIAEPTDDPVSAKRFITRHPRAAFYAGFGDFSFYRLSIDRVHYVGGFAAANWIPGRRLGMPDKSVADAFREAEADIVTHMNTDHQDAVALYANRLLGLRGKHWEMFGIDPEGIDLRLRDRVARLNFDSLLHTPADARKTLIELVRRARG